MERRVSGLEPNEYGGSTKDFKFNRRGDVCEMVMLGKLMDRNGVVWIASEDVEKTTLSYDEDAWKVTVTTPPVTVTYNPAETINAAQMTEITKEPWEKIKAELRSVGISCRGRIVWREKEVDEDPDGEKEGLGNQQVVMDPEPASDHDKGVCGCLAGGTLCNAMKEVRFG